MKYIEELLFELKDEEYASFQSKLTPGIDRDLFIGVRVPECRKLAKNLYKNNKKEVEIFLNELPHKYYDENMLHGLLISEIKDYEESIKYTEAFLPYVDNWAVCDIMKPVSFKKHRDELIDVLGRWMKSDKEYTARFGIEMLMSFYLDDYFRKEYLDDVAAIRSDKYYINMMIAWFFATALAKKWDDTVTYLIDNRLDVWTHNKTIQKAIESYRISDEDKEYLKKLKRKQAHDINSKQ